MGADVAVDYKSGDLVGQLQGAKRIPMQGFVVFDPLHRRPNVEFVLLELRRSGKLKAPVQVVKGLEHVPQTLIDLLEGCNRGKMVVSVRSLQ